MAAPGPVYVRGSKLNPESYYEEKIVGKLFFYYRDGRYQLVEVYRKNGGRKASPTVAVRNPGDGGHIAYPDVSSLYRALILEETDSSSDLTSLMASVSLSSYRSKSSNKHTHDSDYTSSDSDDSASDSS